MENLIKYMLGNIGDDEFNYYLNKYKNLEPHKFAVIKVSGECLETSLEQIVMGLYVLQNLPQNVKLFPAVLFGWGSLLTKKLKQEGIESKFIDGNRVTDKKTLDKIKEVVNDVKKDIFCLSEKYGLKLADLTNEPIFHAKKINDNLGYAGEAIGANIEPIKKACANKCTPLLVPLGYDGNQVYNINADNAAKVLVQFLKPYKYIVITQTGVVLGKDGKLIEKISIADDYKKFLEDGFVKDGMLKKLNEAKELIEKLNEYCVQIIPPEKLFEELFTYKGAGTKIIYGYNTIIYSGLDGVDKNKLTQLIESAFKGKKLVDNYFSTEPITHVVLEEDYDSAAIIEDYKGWAYMDKFAVNEKMEGNGLGSKIFSEALKLKNTGNFSKKSGLFWRCKVENPKKEWYYKKTDVSEGGHYCSGKWIAFWIGGPKNELPDVIDYALNKKETLVGK